MDGFAADVETLGKTVEKVDWMNDALDELGRLDKPWAREAQKARGL